MFRLSLDSNACYASAVVHGDGLISLQFRMAQGEKTQEIRANFKYAHVVQLERVNSTVFMRAARKGQSLELVGHIELPMCEEVFAGLLCAHIIHKPLTVSYFRICGWMSCRQKA